MTTEQLYPLATQDGKSIPLETVSPKAVVNWNIAANSVEAITIPSTVGTLAWLYSTKDVIFSQSHGGNLPSVLIEGTAYLNALMVPASTLVVIKTVPGAGSILNLHATGAANVYLNFVEQWAALYQANQINIG